MLPEQEVVRRLQSRDFTRMTEAMSTLRIRFTDTGFSPWGLADGITVGAPVRSALIGALD